MILPSTYWAALVLSIVSLICLGSWASTFKMAGGKWRFELYYLDFAFAALLSASVAALTLGTFGSELSFVDNVMVTGKRQMAYGLLAGGIFNLANMLLVAAISLAGMTIAIPICLGLALVIGIVWHFITAPGNAAFLLGGAGLVAAALVAASMAHSTHRRWLASQAGKKAKAVGKGVAISLVSGLLMGSFSPLVELAKAGDIGLGPYTLAFCFAVGVFTTTFVFSVYFMNLPVHGQAVELGGYFKGTGREHLLGLFGGMLWLAGALTGLLAASAPKGVQPVPALSAALSHGAPVIGALWGLLVWKEFEGAVSKVRTLLALMLLLFAGGIALISLAASST